MDDETAIRIARLEYAVVTMASWLVQAQTGFGARDARGIDEILVASSRPGEALSEPRQCRAQCHGRALVDAVRGDVEGELFARLAELARHRRRRDLAVGRSLRQGPSLQLGWLWNGAWRR